MTAEEDMKHVLSYVGYMALDTRTASGDWERKFPLKTKKKNMEGRTDILYSMTAIGALVCDLAQSL